MRNLPKGYIRVTYCIVCRNTWLGNIIIIFVINKYVELKVTWIWLCTILYCLMIWWNKLTKFSKQIGNSLTKIINSKVNSRPCQIFEMQLFPQVVTGFKGDIRIFCHTSKMELFPKIVKNKKPFTIYVKTSILDVWQGSEYASDLASKVTDVSFSNHR